MIESVSTQFEIDYSRPIRAENYEWLCDSICGKSMTEQSITHSRVLTGCERSGGFRSGSHIGQRCCSTHAGRFFFFLTLSLFSE